MLLPLIYLYSYRFFLSLPYTLNFLSQLIFLPLRIFFACSSFITTLDCYYPITGYFFYSCLLFFPFSLTWRSSTVYFLLPRPSLPFSLSFSPYFPTCSPFIATFWLLLLLGFLLVLVLRLSTFFNWIIFCSYYLLVISLVLAFCFSSFLLLHILRWFISLASSAFPAYLSSLRTFLPAHLLSQLFGCYYCQVISPRLTFRPFSFFIFRTISHLLISNFNYDAQLALSV